MIEELLLVIFNLGVHFQDIKSSLSPLLFPNVNTKSLRKWMLVEVISVLPLVPNLGLVLTLHTIGLFLNDGLYVFPLLCELWISNLGIHFLSEIILSPTDLWPYVRFLQRKFCSLGLFLYRLMCIGGSWPLESSLNCYFGVFSGGNWDHIRNYSFCLLLSSFSFNF
jgi:hypothetical protein